MPPAQRADARRNRDLIVRAARAAMAAAVVAADMAAVAEAADRARAEGAPADALRSFAGEVVRRGIVAMLPVLSGSVAWTPDFLEERAAVLESVEALVGTARDAGVLRADVGAQDLVLFLSVLTRPLPSIGDGLAADVRERILGVLLDGLRGTTPLPGSPVTAVHPAP